MNSTLKSSKVKRGNEYLAKYMGCFSPELDDDVVVYSCYVANRQWKCTHSSIRVLIDDDDG